MKNKYNFIVWYRADNYNQHITYYQNANRYARHKNFETLEDARAFAKTVKEARITGFHNTMKRYTLEG